MQILQTILLLLLVICAISAALTRKLLASVIIFMAYSLIMSVVWVLLESPDLAVTEAAVGAGVSGILFLVTLKKLQKTESENKDDEDK